MAGPFFAKTDKKWIPAPQQTMAHQEQGLCADKKQRLGHYDEKISAVLLRNVFLFIGPIILQQCEHLPDQIRIQICFCNFSKLWNTARQLFCGKRIKSESLPHNKLRHTMGKGLAPMGGKDWNITWGGDPHTRPLWRKNFCSSSGSSSKAILRAVSFLREEIRN